MTDGQQAAIKADTSTTLAFERTLAVQEQTMLSWIRTATALITFGFTVQQFFRLAREGTERANRIIGPTTFGLAMIVLGLAALLLAAAEHRSKLARLSREFPADSGFPGVPRSRAQVLAALIGLLGMLALVVMVVRG